MSNEKHVLECKDLSVGYNGKAVLEDISVSVESGEVLCLLGPNGVGKSTLFKSLLGLLPIISGTVTVDGERIDKLTRRQLAQKAAYVPQNHTIPFPYSVIDMVLTGAVSRLGLMSNPNKEQYMQAEKILHELNIGDLKNRNFTQLSGGEQQMTLIARSLMQDAYIVLMDEPTAALDLSNQVSVLSTVRELGENGRGIIMITHDPDQCFLCATQVVLITRDGKAIAGSVDEVVTVENLKMAYGVDTRIVETTDEGGHPIKACIPLLESEKPV